MSTRRLETLAAEAHLAPAERKQLRSSARPINEGIEVRPSTISGAGLGMFASVDIEKGETISRYTGTPITVDDNAASTEHAKDYTMKISAAECLVSTHGATTLTHYANHQPNARANAMFRQSGDGVFLVAKKKIGAGEEIFVDYGDEYWTRKDVTPTGRPGHNTTPPPAGDDALVFLLVPQMPAPVWVPTQ
jgi:hypothetical protein